MSFLVGDLEIEIYFYGCSLLYCDCSITIKFFNERPNILSKNERNPSLSYRCRRFDLKGQQMGNSYDKNIPVYDDFDLGLDFRLCQETKLRDGDLIWMRVYTAERELRR